jgi:hypothetical protein
VKMAKRRSLACALPLGTSIVDLGGEPTELIVGCRLHPSRRGAGARRRRPFPTPSSNR